MSSSARRKSIVKILKIAGLFVVFLWFALGGIAHFTNTEFFLNIMPPYLPFHLAAVYVSGVFEIVGALGIVHKATRRMAGLGLIALTIAVTPVNLYMWMTPEAFPEVPESFLTIRLVVQVLLLACIWWSTKPNEG